MLELKNICVSFRRERQDKIFGHTRQQVLFDVSLHVKRGTCLGILGESGSGKSTMGRVLCGLLRPDSGEAMLDGISVYGSRAGRRNLQNKLSVVFQDYTTSANPRFRVRKIIGEGLTVQERREGGRLDRDKETDSLLKMVGLSPDFAGRFPHELSGGQLQRVCIARAVACLPEVIVFDEAISSLDAHTQVQVMDLLRELKDRLGLTYIFITHDLTSITYLCDDVLFLYKGHVTEYLPVNRISEVKDDYARRLLESIVVFDTEEEMAG
ncbi:peptide ABC transporter ATP-binding protein [Anaerotruncus colihominis]|uniref:Peptide ABC transporter ATP-binding protein n=1 Tax=Anaerotruncus colihominis TaxID=169435 RepID=A0A1Y4MF77_9FIRM|nr:dipeptide/oligopeptide/nickel ABC transporter ATP-binding protein [Anaerotruncus colihominis]OUP67424.1 peptide ABC transporter ATP-binding protein [Anaerotruncus colihominis]OUP71241.1 peptide ABC transporter ATP-binding protein [Anaerotruncus colihominis]